MNIHKTAMGPVLAVSLLGCGMLAACANNDGTGTNLLPGLGLSAGKGGSTSVAGSAAGGSTAGTGLGGGGGSSAPVGPVACGSKVCEPSTITVPMLTPLAPCCVSATEGTCGWVDRTGTCTAPPTPDTNCPSSTFGQKGCCIAETNRCGIDASIFGAGCYDLNSSPMFANPMNNPPQTCDGKLVEESDGGMTDLDTDGGVAGMSGGVGGSSAGIGASGMGGAGGAMAAGIGGSGGAGGAGGKGATGAAGRGRPGRAGSFAPPLAGRFAPPVGGRFAPPFGGRKAP